MRTAYFDRLLSRLLGLLEDEHGDNLISVVLYGSVARGDFREDSDIDLLVVCGALPSNRWQRWDPILAVEERLRNEFASAGGHAVPYLFGMPTVHAQRGVATRSF